MISNSTSSIYGLILIGGHSRRMGRDKATLNYGYDRLDTLSLVKNQIDYLEQLFQSISIDRFFVSCREDQREESYLYERGLILDQPEYPPGPMAGILSAFKQFPDVAWLVVACDIPHVDRSTLLSLLEKRNSNSLAVAYLNQTYSRIEPLCTIYEPGIYPTSKKILRAGIKCPQKWLWFLENEIQLLPLSDEQALENINTPEDFLKAQQIIRQKVTDYE